MKQQETKRYRKWSEGHKQHRAAGVAWFCGVCLSAIDGDMGQDARPRSLSEVTEVSLCTGTLSGR
jgi:hypothetical protein